MIVIINDSNFYIEHSFISHEVPTLIWTHGMLSSIESEDIVYSDFFIHIKKSCNLIRYDSLSRGKTQPCSDHEKLTWEHMALDVVAIANHFALEEFYVGGTSMGASVALYTAIKEPSRVKKLVLNMPTGCWEDRAQLKKSYLKMYDIVLKEGVAPIVDRLERTSMPDHLKEFESSNSVNYRYLRDLEQSACLAVIQASIDSDLPDKDKLKSINIDTVIFGWNNFPGHPLSTATTINNYINHSKYIVIDSFDDSSKMEVEL
jgi:pimeloyl-ACP methyl ester carboxylesterase